ncbi:MAG: zinc-binding dehydrogenase [Catenulispora sp.]|nr:zinc-binding dehydrogenase [Catenulispora sp.]
MKALVATGNSDDLLGSLEFADLDEPVAAPDEALVAVEAFSVNRGEALFLRGAYGKPADAGWRPGQDIAGRVVQAAADGSGPAAGTRVVGHPEGRGWAERVAVPTSKLAVLPDGFATVTAAALPLAGLTALRLVRSAGSLTGRRVLLTGASGGVGHYLTELAAGSGAQVTAVSASAERGQRLAELGAAAVVPSASQAPGPFDVVFESVGGAEFEAAIGKLAAGGTVLWYGQAGLVPPTIDFFGLLGATPLTIKHFPHWVSDSTDGQDVATLVRLVEEGRLHPEIGRTADWSETVAVLCDLYERRVRGNAVLTL